MKADPEAMQLVTAYHRNVQKFILALGRGNPKRFSRVYNDKRPIHLAHPMKNKTVLYYPDVRFETRTGKTYIFEVMDTEVGKQALVLAHVFEAFFSPNVLKVFFIVRSQREQAIVANITEVVLGNLEELGGERMNKRVQFYHVVIPPQDARSLERIAKILIEEGELPT